MVDKTGVNFPDGFLGRIDDRRHSTKFRSDWLREASEMRFEIEDAVADAGLGDDLEDDWWHEFLYTAVKREAERRGRDNQEREGIEA